MSKLGQFIAEFKATGLKQIRQQVRDYVRDIKSAAAAEIETSGIRDSSAAVTDAIDTMRESLRSISEADVDLNTKKAKTAAAELADALKELDDESFAPKINTAAIEASRDRVLSAVDKMRSAIRGLSKQSLDVDTSKLSAVVDGIAGAMDQVDEAIDSVKFRDAVRAIPRRLASGLGAGLKAVLRFEHGVVTAVRNVISQFRNLGRASVAGLVRSTRAAFVSMTTAINGARAAATGLIGAVRRLVGVLGLITGIGGITSLIGSFGLLTRSVSAAQQAIQDIQTMSKVLDMPVEELSAFMGFAAQFGVAADDVRQTFTQFYGVAGEARSGSGTQFEVFKSLGIDMTDAANRTKSMTALLQEFSVAVSKLQGSARTSVLTQIFGDDDATKVATLLDAMAKTDAAGYARNKAAMRARGDLVTDADVANAERYRGAVEALKGAFRGLQLTAYRAFGRPFTFLILKAAEVITRYRHEIVNGLGGAWNTAVRFINDFMKVFLQLDSMFGMQIDYLPTTFGWMYEAKSLFDRFTQWLKLLSNSINYWANIIALQMKRVFTPENMKSWLRVTQMYLKDLWALIRGRDEDLTTSTGKKLAAWRDTIVAGVQNTIASIRGIVGGIAMIVASSIDYLTWSWQQMVAGFNATDLTETTGTWYSLGFALQHVSEWTNELIQQLYNVFALGKDATGSFTWINDVKDTFEQLVHNVQLAVAWFRTIYGAVDAFFAQFGIDLGGTLAFLAILRLLGIFDALGLALGAFGKVWKFFFGKEAPGPVKSLVGFIGNSFKGLFGGLLGLVSSFVAGFGQGMVGGLLGHFGTIGKAVTGLGAVLMRAFGPLGWFASIATFTYQLLDTQKAWLDPLVEKITGVEQGIKSAVASANASFDRYGAKPGSAPGTTARAIQQAAAPAYTASGLNYITGGANRPAQHDTFTFKLPGGQTFNGSAERSELDRLKRSSALSLGGA